MEKLAVRRLQSHSAFGAWLSEDVSNHMGRFLRKQGDIKPDCPLIGQDGNICHLVGMAFRTLSMGFPNREAKGSAYTLRTLISYDF